MTLETFDGKMLAVDFIAGVSIVIKVESRLPSRLIVTNLTANQCAKFRRSLFAETMVVLVTTHATLL